MDSGKTWKVFIVFLVLGFVPLSASVSGIDVLVVDDGHNLTNNDEVNYEEGMFNDDYLRSLNSTDGVDAELVKTDYGSNGELGPPVNVLSQYDVVVWYTLSDRDTSDLDNIEETLKSADQERISDYLKNYSGSFFLTGHRLSYDISAAKNQEINFYQKYLGVESNPGSYFRAEIKGDGKLKKNSFEELRLGNMTYDEDDNLALAATDTQIFSSGEVFNIDTDKEPADDFRTISDVCGNRFDDEDELNCKSKQESLKWMNNRPLKDPSGEVNVENVNSNSETSTSSIKVGYGNGGEGRILIVGATTLKSSKNSSKIDSATLNNGRELRQLETVTNGNYTTKAFLLKNPPTGGSVNLRSENGVHISATSVTLSGAAEGITIGAVKTNLSNGSKTSTTVDNEQGEKIIDFVSSSNDLSTDSGQNDMDTVGLGNGNAGLYSFRKGETGTQEMSYKNGGNYTQITLNIERKKTDAEYVIEQDDESLSKNGYPDDYATAFSTFFNNSYRSAVSSFGIESVKRNKSRKKLMEETIRYLTGPVANQTTASAVNNPDLSYTVVNESKYTSKYASISSKGSNSFNPSKLSNARYFYSNSSLGFEPALEYPLEYEQKFEDDWRIEYPTLFSGGRYNFTGSCGTKFGGKALKLYGTDSYGEDKDRDDVALYSPDFNASKVSNLTVEFWAKAPDSDSSCDKPESGETLTVLFKDSGDNYQHLDELSPSAYRGEWVRYEAGIPESDLHENMQILIYKNKSNAEDAWLIDGFSVHQKLGLNGNSHPDKADVGKNLINLTKIEPDLENRPTGLNLTVKAQFKDSSEQGYWGQKEETWIKVDTKAPDPEGTAEFKFGKDYTNNRVVNFTYSNKISPQYRANYIRLSCDPSSGKWSEWKKLDRNLKTEKLSFDVTDPGSGCSNQGNRTVNAQVRDYAGNKPTRLMQDWIVYETEPPTYDGETPENSSAIQSNQEIYINASDNYELDTQKAKYFNGSENISFTPNQSFDPGFSSEGLKEGKAYLFDKASNSRKVPVFYDIDDTPPASNVTPQNSETPANNSAVNSDFNMTVNISDEHFKTVKINYGSGNTSYNRKDIELSPGWTEGASQDFVLWMKDEAGNRRMANYTYDVDDTPPVNDDVKVKNNSYVLNSTRLGYNFTDSISRLVSTSVSENRVGLKRYDLGVDTSWSTEGKHYLQVNASDVVNKKTLNFTYIVDETSPEANIYYENYNTGDWTDKDVSLNINATDNMNMSKIFYCKRDKGSSCTLNSESQPGKNVSETLTCSQGNTCKKVVEYNARDSAGNMLSSSPAKSSNIKMDKEKPEITGLRPKGTTVSGNITISAGIVDEGSGLNSADLKLYNSSNVSQVYETGSLRYDSGSEKMVYDWNSGKNISEVGNVTVNITASDYLGYEASIEGRFTVDNQRANVQIKAPFQEVVNKDFRLNLTAVRPGSGDITSHNYSIEDGSTEVYSNQTTSINQGTHRYDLVFDTGQIGGDNNYTLNTSAVGGGNEFATVETWFYLDREAPETLITSNLNGTWQEGEITVNFKATDKVKNGTIKYRYRDNSSSWKNVSLTYGAGSFQFNTEKCKDNAGRGCEIKLVAEDAAGNKNSSKVSFNVDNSKPSATIDSPAPFTWQNSTFQVERTVTDKTAEKSDQGLSCSYQIKSGNYQNTASCNSSINIDIPDDCGDHDEQCVVTVKASNPAGLTETVDRTFRVDTNPPKITESYPRPINGSIINGNQSITYYFQDDFSGITYSLLDDGNNRQKISEGEAYEPQWTESGEKVLDLELNDTAENFKERTYNYIFDDEKPRVNTTSVNRPYDSKYGGIRIYRGQSIKLNVSVNENIKMDEVLLGLNETGTVNEYTLNVPEDLQNGTWTLSLPSSKSGYYNFTKLELVDRAGNKRINRSLKGYRVINYSQAVRMGGDTEIPAGKQQGFNLTVDFNKTVGKRDLDLFIPPSSPQALKDPYYTLSNTQCTVSGCNVSTTSNKIELNYTGNKDKVNITGNIRAETEQSDRNKAFISVLENNQRESPAILRTPELEVENLSCGNCQVNQFENFTLSADTLNNNTAANTGKAFNVALKISSNSSGNPVETSKPQGNISTGENTSESFKNLSFDRAGTFRVDTVVEDRTGSYSDTNSINVRVFDVLKPEINSTGTSSTRININDSVTLEADITDNKVIESANITVQLPNGTEIASNMSRARADRFISIFSNTSSQGIYDITKIEAVDQRGNKKVVDPNQSFKVTQLRLDANVSKTSISNSEAVNFSINITGNSSKISNVKINATAPKNKYRAKTYENVDKIDNLTFEKFRNSGNYSFNLTVNSGLSITNQTQNVFVKFGESSIEALSGQNNTVLVPTGSDVGLPWNISTKNGGLRNTSLRFSSGDISKVDAPSSTKNIGDITFEQGQKITDFNVSPGNTGNVTVQLNASPENGSNSTDKLDIRVINSDQLPPNITSYSISDSVLNVGENQSFRTEVKELSVLENVTLKVESNKTGKTWEKKMNRLNREQFSYDFSESDQTGVYNYTIQAYDISGNNVTKRGNYSVSDKYQIQVSKDKKLYVKGDNPRFDIEILDMSGEEVQNYSSNVTVDKGSAEKEIATGTVEKASTNIFISDPPAPSTSANNLPIDYGLKVNVTKGENSGLYTENIDVTRRLRIREFDTVEEFIPEGGNFTVKGRWVEPGGYGVDGRSASFVTCRGCEQEFKLFDPINSSTNLRSQTFSVPNGTDSVLVQAVISNAFGNSESQITNDPAPTINIDLGGQGTATNSTGNTGLPSGGLSGGGGGPTMEITRLSPNVSVPPSQDEINLSVNSNIAAECVYSRNAIPESVSFEEAKAFENTGGIMHNSMLNLEESMTYSYNIMCSSDAANGTTDIIFSKGERELSAFQPSFPETLTPGNDSINQESNGSGLFTVYNNQSKALDLQFKVESKCCNGKVVENSREIDSTSVESGEEKGLSLSMYAPLYVEEGVHSATLTIYGENATRQRQISFDVENNEQVSRFEELSQRTNLLNSSISRYRIAGIDTSRMRKAFDNLTAHLDEANNSIQENNLEGLKTALEKGQKDADRIDRMLEDASLKKFVLLNWWKWALGFVIAYVVFFLIVMVGIPYYRIKTELTRVNSQLESATEARKKGEKQYFQRKIDKDTFNQMMTERQNEVLELRGEKEDLKEELDRFLRSQLTLKNYIKAPSKGLDELGKWWAANKKARENLKGKEDEDSE